MDITLEDVGGFLSEKGNPEMAEVINTFAKNYNETVGKINTLENDVKTSAEKRDKLKTMIRNATGLDEITEEALKEVLAGGGDEVIKKENDALRASLAESTTAVDKVSAQYVEQINDLKLERALTMLGVDKEAQSPHAFKSILTELKKGAVFEGDNIVYKNPDGTSIFASNGKEATIETMYNNFKADPTFEYLFAEKFRKGGGKPSGPTKTEAGTAFKRSSMKEDDKVKYIAQHGMSAYMNLPL